MLSLCVVCLLKGGVVLADSQPLTDRQIQQRLLREMAGLSCTASDADTEPCSPTRLLHNIERQVGRKSTHTSNTRCEFDIDRISNVSFYTLCQGIILFYLIFPFSVVFRKAQEGAYL